MTFNHVPHRMLDSKQTRPRKHNANMGNYFFMDHSNHQKLEISYNHNGSTNSNVMIAIQAMIVEISDTSFIGAI